MARIERVEIHMVDLKPKTLRADAIQTFESQETPIVRVADADGATGVGCSYTIGTGGPSVAALLERTLAPTLIGRDAETIEGIQTSGSHKNSFCRPFALRHNLAFGQLVDHPQIRFGADRSSMIQFLEENGQRSVDGVAESSQHAHPQHAVFGFRDYVGPRLEQIAQYFPWAPTFPSASEGQRHLRLCAKSDHPDQVEQQVPFHFDRLELFLLGELSCQDSLWRSLAPDPQRLEFLLQNSDFARTCSSFREASRSLPTATACSGLPALSRRLLGRPRDRSHSLFSSLQRGLTTLVSGSRSTRSWLDSFPRPNSRFMYLKKFSCGKGRTSRSRPVPATRRGRSPRTVGHQTANLANADYLGNLAGLPSGPDRQRNRPFAMRCPVSPSMPKGP